MPDAVYQEGLDTCRVWRRRATQLESGPAIRKSDGFERYVGLEHLDPGDLKIRRWGNVSDGTTFTNVFRAGQVLFGKRRAYQRKVAVADFDGVCSGDIYVFEPKNEHLLPELLPFICQTDGFFEHAVGTSAGSLSPRTNWDSLADTSSPCRRQKSSGGSLRFSRRHKLSWTLSWDAVQQRSACRRPCWPHCTTPSPKERRFSA